MSTLYRNDRRYRTRFHYLRRSVVHAHDTHGGAWCCIDHTDPEASVAPPIAAAVPLTCFWCLTGLLGSL